MPNDKLAALVDDVSGAILVADTKDPIWRGKLQGTIAALCARALTGDKQ
jgi:hypothetical protein